MNQQQKDVWLAALRSGQYPQGTGFLKAPDGRYCCLGVAREACKLPINTHGVTHLYDWDCNCTFLPMHVQHELARMNDNGESFAQIADYIEQHIPPTE